MGQAIESIGSTPSLSAEKISMKSKPRKTLDFTGFLIFYVFFLTQRIKLKLNIIGFYLAVFDTFQHIDRLRKLNHRVFLVQ